MDSASHVPSDEDATIVVVGAGPHALTFCAYLLRSRPEWRRRLVVVDPQGWLEAWNAKLARLEIDVLRSPCVHHPDPSPYALLEFAAFRPRELIGSYKSPTAALFADFCAALIDRHGLDEVLMPGRVTGIGTARDGRHRVALANGDHLEAAQVIVATNSARPRLPPWAADAGWDADTESADVESAAVGAMHAAIIDPAVVGAGERIAVVGGGLTAAQLCVAAMARGASTALLTRTGIRCSITDVDPGWLSRPHLGRYLEERDWERRAQQYQSARRGTMPQAWADRLRTAAADATLDLREGVTVTAAGPASDGGWALHTSSGLVVADRVWLATGWIPDVQADPLLAPLAGSQVVAGGLPLLDAACRFPGTQVHVTGSMAALQVGALAPNLAGARIAAERIVGTLTNLATRQYPSPPAGGHHPAGTGRV